MRQGGFLNTSNQFGEKSIANAWHNQSDSGALSGGMPLFSSIKPIAELLTRIADAMLHLAANIIAGSDHKGCGFRQNNPT